MDTRKCGLAFFVAFLILVLNGSFTNGIIEVFKATKNPQAPDAEGVNRQNRIAIEVTRKIFTIVREIFVDNYEAASKLTGLTIQGMKDKKCRDIDLVAMCIDAEANAVTAENLSQWTDDEKDDRAVALIASLTTKFLAYLDALNYAYYMFLIYPTDDDTLKLKAAYALYLIEFARLINAPKITEAIKMLLNSTTKYAGESILVERTFDTIRNVMVDLEKTVGENVQQIVYRKIYGAKPGDPELKINHTPIEILLPAFANMLYECKIYDEKERKTEEFKAWVYNAYETKIFENFPDGETDVNYVKYHLAPVDLLETIEYLLSREFHSINKDYLTHTALFYNEDTKYLKTDIKNGQIVLTQADIPPARRRSPRPNIDWYSRP